MNSSVVVKFIKVKEKKSVKRELVRREYFMYASEVLRKASISGSHHEGENFYVEEIMCGSYSRIISLNWTAQALNVNWFSRKVLKKYKTRYLSMIVIHMTYNASDVSQI